MNQSIFFFLPSLCSDGVNAATTPAQDLSEKQLLRVAKQLGTEWKQVAIYLGLKSRELDDIQASEKDVNMQKLKMLVEWKSRRGSGEATASHLLKSLEDLDDLPNEVYQTLKGTTHLIYRRTHYNSLQYIISCNLMIYQI